MTPPRRIAPGDPLPPPAKHPDLADLVMPARIGRHIDGGAR